MKSEILKYKHLNCVTISMDMIIGAVFYSLALQLRLGFRSDIPTL